jgi:hypothetical protein
MLKHHLPVGFVVPAQPVEREKPPAGAEWGALRSRSARCSPDCECGLEWDATVAGHYVAH